MKPPFLLATALSVSTSLMAGCAALDQWTKPRVEGLQKTQDFTSASLTEGGFGTTLVRSSLSGDEVNTEVLETMLDGAIRSKRPDVTVGAGGRYQAIANVIANDVGNRGDDLEGTIYRWTNRRVKISYVVVDASSGKQVWSGIIETSDESLASYEKKKKKSSGKLIDAIASAITKKEDYPYPNPPYFTDIAKRNFEGFALNLPIKN